MSLPTGYQAVVAHYERRWGKASRLLKLDGPQVPQIIRPLYVGVFALPADGLTVYASVGMSRAPMPSMTVQPDHRLEVYLGTFQAYQELPEAVAMLAAYPLNAHTSLGPEHTVPVGAPLVPGSQMTSILLCPPYFDPPDFATFKLAEYHVQILWAIPLHESERKFKAEHGYKALMDLFEERGIVVGDLTRRPLI